MRVGIKNLLKFGAIVGVGVTAALAVNRSDGIKRVAHDIKHDAPEEKKDKLWHYVKSSPKMIKPAWPVLVSGAGTIACVIAMDRISYKQIAALTASCVYLTKNRDFLEKKLKETVGEERLQEIKQQFIKEEIPNYLTTTVEETGQGDLLCFEGYSGRWFRSSKEAIEEAQEYLNKMFDEDIYCCLNDYYAFLNISMSQMGHELGWVNNKDYYPPKISFTNTYLTAEEWNDRGPLEGLVKEPVYVLEIDSYSMPMYSWQEI